MKRLKEKVILLAGAGGLGNALARRYAEEGACVVLGHNHLDDARAVVEGINGTGGIATAVHLDGTDEESIGAAIALAQNKYGGLDGLHVNFAATSLAREDSDVLGIPLDTLDGTMRVNLRGYFLCTRHALPALLARGAGAILYTSSIAAHSGETMQVAYAMSKAANHALMRHVASKYGPQGVRANAIAPSVIRHEKWAYFPSEIVTQLEGMSLNRSAIKSRICGTEDVAALSTLLMSNEGSFITGQVICVDGGITMRP